MAITNLKSYLSDIADAIRYAESSTGLINARLFNERIKVLHGGQPVPPEDVPQTGTWQYKITPSTGFIIIGKDDDTTDQAMYVRMVTGYGFPVTINTTWSAAYNMSSHRQIPDVDSEFSLYPEGSVSRVPEYCSVHDLNKIIIDNNLGEVAQHGESIKNIWDSRDVTDEQIDYMYSNYTNGGGTKSREEFWDLFKETFRDCDAAFGAEYAKNDRKALEEDLGIPIRTAGCWGASGERSIEGIVVCPVSYLAHGTYPYAREWNYWGDGPVTSYNSNNVRDPYRITRDSTGFNSVDTVTRDMEYAYRDASCIELFVHLYFTGYGTQAQWEKLKSLLDTIKMWVDDGKIRVVTRYEYSQLGEYVDNPIVSISLSKDAMAYRVGDTITDGNFTCNVMYSDGSIEICKSDRILDISGIDTSAEGTYEAELRYRGFRTTCPVLVLNDIPSEFLLENKTYSGDTFAYSNAICREESFIPVQGKSYHFEFDVTVNIRSIQYATHDVAFRFNYGNATPISPYVKVEVGINKFHVSMTYNCTRIQSNKDLFIVNGHNFGGGEWTINNLYCWEVDE